MNSTILSTFSVPYESKFCRLSVQVCMHTKYGVCHDWNPLDTHLIELDIMQQLL